MQRCAGCAIKTLVMIPNLNELPPLPEEESPLKKLVRPLAGGLLLLVAVGGLLWVLSYGVGRIADTEMNVLGGLRGVAADLWQTGTAPEIRLQDPDLAGEITRLRAASLGHPEIVVVPAEPGAGTAKGTHQLIFLSGTRPMLTISVFFDEMETKVDILSYETGKDFPDPLAPSR